VVDPSLMLISAARQGGRIQHQEEEDMTTLGPIIGGMLFLGLIGFILWDFMVTAFKNYDDNTVAVAVVVKIIVFIGAWGWCALHYGFLFGFGLGWLPAGILAAIAASVAAVIWPLVVILISVGGFIFFVYLAAQDITPSTTLGRNDSGNITYTYTPPATQAPPPGYKYEQVDGDPFAQNSGGNFFDQFDPRGKPTSGAGRIH
jgi:hypothetical protein